MFQFFEKLKSYHIVLASGSPRRQQLLRELGVPYHVILKPTEESYPDNLQREEIALYLAEQKANVFDFSELPCNTLLITADTIVCLDDKVLGKPQDFQEAEGMLQQLSGQKHTVITGVSLKTKDKQHSFYATTEVFFRKLNIDEIRYYIEKYQPYDKAGSYGVQEWIGYTAIERIEGSFYNVMGLPMQRLYVELVNF